MKTPAVVITFALAMLAQANEVERVFRFTDAVTPEQMQQTLDAFRFISQVKLIALNRGELIVHGTPEQVRVAEWIFRELDGVGSGQFSSTNRTDDRRFPAVRVFHLTQSNTPQLMIEAVNVVRFTTETPFILPCFWRSVLVLRGTESQTQLADWILREIEHRPVPPRGTIHALVADADIYAAPDARAVRVFFQGDPVTPTELRTTVNSIRSSTQCERVVSHPTLHAIFLRGTDQQATAAAILIQQSPDPK